MGGHSLPFHRRRRGAWGNRALRGKALRDGIREARHSLKLNKEFSILGMATMRSIL